jgi:hypothetical protein
MILAKPVIANKYWILKENDEKIGAVEASDGGFTVRMYNDQQQFKTIKTIKNKTRIIFEEPPEKKKQKKEHVVNGFATGSTPYNAIYDVQRRLPIFTKKKKSKSWFAAGHYQIEINGRWETQFCPKLILLQRYEYRGPVNSPEEFSFQ